MAKKRYQLSEKDRRRLKRKSDLTRIRQKPEFRTRRDPGSKNKKPKYKKDLWEGDYNND